MRYVVDARNFLNLNMKSKIVITRKEFPLTGIFALRSSLYLELMKFLLRVNSAFFAMITVGCAVQGSNSADAPAIDKPSLNRSERPSAAINDVLFEPNRIIRSLDVNSTCASLAATRSTFMTYIAGDCNSRAEPEGYARARYGGRFHELIEGIFDQGQIVPGVLYTVLYENLPSYFFHCTNIDISIQNTGIESIPVYRSTRTSVCHEYSRTTSRVARRILQPSIDGALEPNSNNGIKVLDQSPGLGENHYSNGRREIFSGVFHPGPTVGWGQWRHVGSQVVQFPRSKVTYEARGNSLLCVVGSDACGPLYFVDNNLQRWAPRYDSNSGPSRKVLIRDTFSGSNGIKFVPDSVDPVPYEVRYGDVMQASDGWILVGDVVAFRPKNGTLIQPNGAQYTGRFFKGQPMLK